MGNPQRTISVKENADVVSVSLYGLAMQYYGCWCRTGSLTATKIAVQLSKCCVAFFILFLRMWTPLVGKKEYQPWTKWIEKNQRKYTYCFINPCSGIPSQTCVTQIFGTKWGHGLLIVTVPSCNSRKHSGSKMQLGSNQVETAILSKPSIWRNILAYNLCSPDGAPGFLTVNPCKGV